MNIKPSGTFAKYLKEAGAENPYLCYQCHRCSSGCPTAAAMNMTPSRMMRMAQLGQKEAFFSDPSIWRCLGCDSCTQHCPHKVSVRKLVELLRQETVQDFWLKDNREIFSADEGLSKGLRALDGMSERLKTFHNVSGEDNANRLSWTANLPEKIEGIDRKKGADLIYFVGCVSAMFPMSYGIPQSFTNVLRKWEVSFTTLGSDEWCCGFPLLMSGQLKQARELMEHNVEKIHEIGASRVVMTCPSCHYMWKHRYPEELGKSINLEIVTASEVLNDLAVSGSFKFPEPKKTGVVTYHDPCDLGRKGGHYAEPRDVLSKVPGFSFVEMENSKEHALCCGGGGDMETFQSELTAEVSARRIAQAAAAGADHLVSACPQCVRTLSKAAKAAKLRIRVMDLVQFVDSAI